MQIFLDCDGVLADFVSGATALFNEHPQLAEERLGKRAFWEELMDADEFFAHLPPIGDAHLLYAGVRHYFPEVTPTILTAGKLPNRAWMEPQKNAWRDQHFPGTPMIVCNAADKCLHGKPGDILIDDYPKYQHKWEAMGGIFILHKSAAQSLRELAGLRGAAVPA